MALGRIQLGVSPIAWTNDDLPALGGATPLTVCLQDASELGFEGIELGGKFPRAAPELSTLLKTFGLRLISGWFSGELYQSSCLETEKKRLEPHIALLQSQGCSILVYADVSHAVHGAQNTSIRQSPAIEDDRWNDYGENLTALAEHIANQGLTLAFHHHMGTLIETGAELERLLSVTSETVKLTLDTGHAAMAGIDPTRIIEICGSRIAHIHLKDIRSEIAHQIVSADKSFLDGVMAGMFTVPGDGALDFAEIVAALNAENYSGWVVIEAEQDPNQANPRDFSERGLNHIKSIIHRIVDA